MRAQIKLLKVELEEHAEVENELAKRSHFCQRVIAKYKTQVQVLKEELEERQVVGGHSVSGKASTMMATKGNNQFSKNDLTQFLQRRIMEYESK